LAFGLTTHEGRDDFVWLFNAWSDMRIDLRQSQVIFTDRDLGMKTAISMTLPDVKHRVCLWHVEQNLVQNTSSILGDHFKETLNMFKNACIARDEETFQRRWTRLINFIGKLNLQNPKALEYFGTLHDQREDIAAYSSNGLRTLGLLSTQRVESINGIIKGLIGRMSTLASLTKSLEHLANDIQDKTTRLLKQSVVVPTEFQWSANVAQIARRVSAEIFEQIVEELRSANKFFVQGNNVYTRRDTSSEDEPFAVATIADDLCSLGDSFITYLFTKSTERGPSRPVHSRLRPRSWLSVPPFSRPSSRARRTDDLYEGYRRTLADQSAVDCCGHLSTPSARSQCAEQQAAIP